MTSLPRPDAARPSDEGRATRGEREGEFAWPWTRATGVPVEGLGFSRDCSLTRPVVARLASRRGRDVRDSEGSGGRDYFIDFSISATAFCNSAMISLWVAMTFSVVLFKSGSDFILAMSWGAAGQEAAFFISSVALS